jgi:hypothetical protein
MGNIYTTGTQASPGLQVPTPGQPIQNIGITTQGGMFPPGANSAGATSSMAEMSSAKLPANALVSNEGTGLPTPSIMSALSSGTDGGNIANAANGIPFGSGFNGGGGGSDAGGGANVNGGNAVVGDTVLGGQANPLTGLSYIGTTAATQYAG